MNSEEGRSHEEEEKMNSEDSDDILEPITITHYTQQQIDACMSTYVKAIAKGATTIPNKEAQRK